MLTAPQLFAASRGADCQSGPHRCFYCGGVCGDSFSAREFVKDSFTGLGDVAAPGSRFVCGGCVACLNERADVTLPDGTLKSGQKVRSYSWVLTADHSTAASKAHRDYLSRVCLDPPEPPFSVVISDSGQKHLLYRGVVCHTREVVTVTLEAERIEYRPDALRSRMVLCRRLIAATGKPALAQGLSYRQQAAIYMHYGTAAHLADWRRVSGEPLSRLALWLSPAKEECLNEFPAPAA